MMPCASICGEHYRFTLLTPALIRMEYSPDGYFEDRTTQMVVNRDFPAPEYRLWRTDGGIEIKTDSMNVYYNEKEFSAEGLRIENRSECRGIYCTWHYGDVLNENLGGTARTIDEADGAIPLENGILSRLQGYSVLDDSRSYALTKDNWLEAPKPGHIDLYFFSYGYAYKRALKDFFKLCGETPLLPRYALGNWWSRFYAYSAESYLELMRRFKAEGIPLSVAVIDMNWHDSSDGPDHKGWTGYTWDKKLFPDPAAFLAELHGMGLATSLNLHPAEGIQPHEEMYPEVARALSKDAQRRQQIPFEPSSRAFWDAYFKYAHHPREAEGVDFWWIDWQQGGVCALPDLDPLWLLNHLHTQDAARNGARALILSRYAGAGSHRYPLGFSGDSVISWKTLDFQPYFTATASNIGYGWWSHDIGGHTHGKRDDELQLRWLQYGVFSPIMRMHSTCNPFNGKEPWRYGTECRGIMRDFLRLRHRLLPYLYSMNHRCHEEGELLIQPMYYDHPREEAAYQMLNQYMFGSELMVMPITQPMSHQLRMGSVVGWLPKGEYYDLFTGVRYIGGHKQKFFRPLDSIPVLARAGAILPLMQDALAQEVIPETLELCIFAGADGAFELYEDDGRSNEYRNGSYLLTELRMCDFAGEQPRFTICPLHSDTVLTRERSYALCFIGVEAFEGDVCVTVDAQRMFIRPSYDARRHALTITLPRLPMESRICVDLPKELRLAPNDSRALWEDMLNRAQISYEMKAEIWSILCSGDSALQVLHSLQALSLPSELLDAICEYLD